MTVPRTSYNGFSIRERTAMQHFKFYEQKNDFLWFLRGRRTLTVAIILYITIVASILTACGAAATKQAQHPTKTPTLVPTVHPTPTPTLMPTPLPTPPPTEAAQ